MDRKIGRLPRKSGGLAALPNTQCALRVVRVHCPDSSNADICAMSPTLSRLTAPVATAPALLSFLPKFDYAVRVFKSMLQLQCLHQTTPMNIMLPESSGSVALTPASLSSHLMSYAVQVVRTHNYYSSVIIRLS